MYRLSLWFTTANSIKTVVTCNNYQVPLWCQQLPSAPVVSTLTKCPCGGTAPGIDTISSSGILPNVLHNVVFLIFTSLHLPFPVAEASRSCPHGRKIPTEKTTLSTNILWQWETYESSMNYSHYLKRYKTRCTTSYHPYAQKAALQIQTHRRLKTMFCYFLALGHKQTIY